MLATAAAATIGGILGLLLLWLLPTILVYRIANRKGRDGWIYVVAALLIGWPLPLLAALIIRKTPA